jgi:hypothetical protein
LCFDAYRTPAHGTQAAPHRAALPPPLLEYGHDLANQTYLYGEPFSRPKSAGPAHTVPEPSLDPRTTLELVAQFRWMRERTLQICH